TTSFIRGAISATRAVAPLHQCLSHISQITTAVAAGSYSAGFSTTFHWPGSLDTSRRNLRARTSAQRPSPGRTLKVISSKNKLRRGKMVSSIGLKWSKRLFSEFFPALSFHFKARDRTGRHEVDRDAQVKGGLEGLLEA